MESYRRQFPYVAKLIIHRYAMLGILDEHGYPIQQMGVLEIPEIEKQGLGIKTISAKACKECGNATLDQEGWLRVLHQLRGRLERAGDACAFWTAQC